MVDECLHAAADAEAKVADAQAAVRFLKEKLEDLADILLSSTCNIQGQGSEMSSSFCSSTVSLSAGHIP